MKKPTKAAKLNPISIRFYPDVMKALRKAARDDDRPLSVMAEKAVTDWLRDRGYLKREKEF